MTYRKVVMHLTVINSTVLKNIRSPGYALLAAKHYTGSS